jgi:hypothetical protein
MARTVKDAKLDSRNARDKLKPRPRPYYKMLIRGTLHLGYRRRGKGKGAQGRWLVRYYLGLDAGGVGRYREKDLGLADDFRDANGVEIFNYDQAQARALKWHSDKSATTDKSGSYTVNNALDDYLTWLESEGRSAVAISDARGRAYTLIRPKLGDKEVDKLTSNELRSWRDGVAKSTAARAHQAGRRTAASKAGDRCKRGCRAGAAQFGKSGVDNPTRSPQSRL